VSEDSRCHDPRDKGFDSLLPFQLHCWPAVALIGIAVVLCPSPAHFDGRCGRNWVEGRYVVVVRADWPRLIQQATEVEVRERSKSEQKYLH
jgi:hypothetical protein